VPVVRALALLLLLAASTLADFDAANRAYDEGKFNEAKAGYEALAQRGEWSANLFYNLGNTEARVGEQGRAILNYERALALQPGHIEARANLKFLRDQSTAKTPPKKWRDATFGMLTFSGWLVAATVSGWVLLFCLALPFAFRRRMTPSAVFFAVVSLCCCATAAAGVGLQARELDVAVIVAKQVEARQAPADRAALADVLPAGSRVRWRAERSGWVECELPDGGIGWLPVASVEKVRL
jgi:hypothetical protein